MKKIYYLIICMFISFSATAQSYWAEGFEANFDQWVDITDDEGNVTGQRPKGWHAPWNSYWDRFGAPVVKLSAVEDRFGKANSACRIETTGAEDVGGLTWHISFKLAHWTTMDDYNPLYIDLGDEFYYTFWAKAEEEGAVMWIGTEQIYDPAHGALGWDKMPHFELTTEWRQYGFQEFAIMDLTSFMIHIRDNGVLYIDDIDLAYGKLPEIEDPEPNGIFEIASDKSMVSILSSQNGIELNSMEGTVTVYDVIGNKVVTDQLVNEGNSFIPLSTKGLHILLFENGENRTVIKTVVR